MSDLSKIKVGGKEYEIKDTAARSHIDTLEGVVKDLGEVGTVLDLTNYEPQDLDFMTITEPGLYKFMLRVVRNGTNKGYVVGLLLVSQDCTIKGDTYIFQTIFADGNVWKRKSANNSNLVTGSFELVFADKKDFSTFYNQMAESKASTALVRHQLRIKVLPYYTMERDYPYYIGETYPMESGVGRTLSWALVTEMRFIRVATQGNFDFGEINIKDYTGQGSIQKNEIVCFARAYRRAKRKGDGYTYRGKIRKGYFPVKTWDSWNYKYEEQYVKDKSYSLYNTLISGKDFIKLNNDEDTALFGIKQFIDAQDNKTKTVVYVPHAYKRTRFGDRSFVCDNLNHTLSVHVAFARRISWRESQFITGEPVYGKITLTYDWEKERFSMSFVQN